MMATDRISEARQRATLRALLVATLELGRVPTRAELGDRVEGTPDALRRDLIALAEAHEVVLEDTLEVRMLMPFSARQTQHVVRASGQRWFANCAWDALGIPQALAGMGTAKERTSEPAWPLGAAIETSCPITGEIFGVERGDPWCAHFAVPASRWWEDIGFT